MANANAADNHPAQVALPSAEVDRLQLQAVADGIRATADTLPAAEQLEAAVGQLEAAVGQLEAAVTQLSGAAGLLPDASAAANNLRVAVDTLRLALNDRPTLKDQLRSLADQLTTDAEAVRNFRHTSADADLVGLRRFEQTLLSTRDKLIYQFAGDFPPISLVQIRNLLDTDHDPILRKAREEWLRRDADLSKKVARREASRADVRNQIYNIIGFYAVYLGVVLTAVSQLTQTETDSELKCKKHKFPIILTAFGWFVTTLAVIYKFWILHKLETTIQSYKQSSAELQHRTLQIQTRGLAFDFRYDTKDNLPKRAWTRTDWIAYISAYFSPILALFFFSGLFIYSYFTILCNTWTT